MLLKTCDIFSCYLKLILKFENQNLVITITHGIITKFVDITFINSKKHFANSKIKRLKLT